MFLNDHIILTKKNQEKDVPPFIRDLGVLDFCENGASDVSDFLSWSLLEDFWGAG